MANYKPPRPTAPDNLLGYLRTYYGLSQQNLASKCGIGLAVVWRMEKRLSSICFGSALKVAGCLGVPLDALVRNSFEDAIPYLRPIPQLREEVREKLRRRQELRDEIGYKGEDLVAQREREKLRGTPFEKGVNSNYANDLSAGFDVFSFTTDGRPLYIEVKSTQQECDRPFFLSDNEKNFMEACAAKGRNYELHRVYNLGHKNCGVKIYTAAELLGFCYTPTEFKVSRKEASA